MTNIPDIPKKTVIEDIEQLVANLMNMDEIIPIVQHNLTIKLWKMR